MIFSRISIARTPMARLPWIIRTRFFESLQNSSDISRNQIFRDFFLILSWNCMLCVLIRIASSRRFLWVHTIYNCGIEDRKISQNHRHLHPDLEPWLTHSGSNYPCLEQFSMVPKMFELLKFDCMGQRTTKPMITHVRQTKSQVSLNMQSVWQGFSFIPLWIARVL